MASPVMRALAILAVCVLASCGRESTATARPARRHSWRAPGTALSRFRLIRVIRIHRHHRAVR